MLATHKHETVHELSDRVVLLIHNISKSDTLEDFSVTRLNFRRMKYNFTST